MRSFIRGSSLDNCCCCLVVSDSFRPHGLQHARLPCPSLYPGVMPSNHLILCRPLLLPSIFPSIRVFSSESALRISWPKYWSFSIIPSNEYSGLISFRRDWFDLFAVQGTLKSLLQHHSLKTSNSRVLPLNFQATLPASSECYEAHWTPGLSRAPQWSFEPGVSP